MRIFRLHRSHRSAANYDGSLILGSRWNPAGVPMLYCSTVLSLACLEVLVHLGPDQIPADYVYSTAELSDDPEESGFRGDLADLASTRRYGQFWAASERSLAVLAPSVIIPIEFNVLLNPRHAAYQGILWSTPQPFAFDDRLLKRSGAVA